MYQKTSVHAFSLGTNAIFLFSKPLSSSKPHCNVKYSTNFYKSLRKKLKKRSDIKFYEYHIFIITKIEIRYKGEIILRRKQKF